MRTLTSTTWEHLTILRITSVRSEPRQIIVRFESINTTLKCFILRTVERIKNCTRESPAIVNVLVKSGMCCATFILSQFPSRTKTIRRPIFPFSNHLLDRDVRKSNEQGYVRAYVATSMVRSFCYPCFQDHELTAYPIIRVIYGPFRHRRWRANEAVPPRPISTRSK